MTKAELEILETAAAILHKEGYLSIYDSRESDIFWLARDLVHRAGNLAERRFGLGGS